MDLFSGKLYNVVRGLGPQADSIRQRVGIIMHEEVLYPVFINIRVRRYSRGFFVC